MNRRDFLISAAAATSLAAAGRASAQTSADQKRARIAVMMFGLNSIVKTNMPSAPERTLELMDIGQLCADRFKIHNVELQSNYFPSTELTWLRDFKSKLEKTKTSIVQINLEFGAGYNMAAETPTGRLQMIDLHRVWIDKAAFLGCPRLLLNQGVPTPENKALLISNYGAIVAIAKAKGITVASENRNAPGAGRGATAPAAGQAAPAPVAAPPPAGPSYPILVEILRASGAHACADFLNFPNPAEQLAGLRAMLALTHGLVHAGMRHDMPPAMAICKELGYKGLYSIKANAVQGPDPIENTQRILDGLLATM